MTVWRWAALAALGVIACVIGFAMIPGINACGTANDPILAFEFVISPDEVAALFPQDCRAVAAGAQRTGLLFDAFVFIPVYSAFLILSLVALRREARGPGLAGAAIAAVLIAALLDQFEGVQLWRILADMPGTEDMISLLMPAVRGKFALLGLAVLAIGWLHVRAGRWRIGAGALIMLGALWSLFGLVSDYHRVSEGSALAWLALIVTTFVLAWRREASAAA